MKNLIILLFALLAWSYPSAQGCLPEGITFSTQEQIDNFQTNYPGCTEIQGDVKIWGETITNLSGLSVLNSLAGNLSILNNNVLTSLSGLDSLTFIGGRLNILYNPNLTSIFGLNNLISIGGGLSISDNYSLSTCEVQWLCDYLSNPEGSIYIMNNAPGCNSVVELAMACGGSLPCLPYGNYIFTSQADIDNFHLAFPNCMGLLGNVSIIDMIGGDISNLDGLNMLTSIVGDFSITYNALTSLTGLEGLTSIGGELRIENSSALINLEGLEGLDSIGSGLRICGNDALSSLTGLEGLNTLSGDLNIGFMNKWGETCGNPSLTSLAGLEGLNSLAGDILITSNDNLTSLTGLDNLNSIEGNLTIYVNSALTSLTGLDNLTSIGGELQIIYNTALTSLMALGNMDLIGGDLSISYNYLLSTCEAQWLCDYLNNPGGTINISWNASGCNSVIEVASACGGSVPCLPYGNYYFTSQSDIDNFQTAFQGCNTLEGEVIINSGSDITNLNGLNVLTFIDEKLEIQGNSALNSLTGLEGLNSIGGELHISYNPALTSLIGLEGLNSIGGWFHIELNSSLTSLTGLDSLTSIGGPFTIEDNDGLTSLTGLEGLVSIGTNLNITNNDALANLTGLQNLTSVKNLYISSNGALTDLTGLQGLTSVENLYISSNGALTALTGIENLNRVWGIYLCDNPVLSSLTGLEGLTTIQEYLTLGYVTWGGCGNPALTSLTGLENVSFIGNINIQGNETLISLTGIEHLDPDSIGGLAISYNGSLSACSNPFVCNYIKDHSADIHDNAPGCNNVEEVEAACLTEVPEQVVSRQSSVVSYPNPTDGISYFAFRISQCQWVSLKIYNAQGQEVAVVLDQEMPAGEHVVRWDADGLPAGVFYYQLRAKGIGQVGAGKIVKY
jgi:hypothetical protein